MGLWNALHDFNDSSYWKFMRGYSNGPVLGSKTTNCFFMRKKAYEFLGNIDVFQVNGKYQDVLPVIQQHFSRKNIVFLIVVETGTDFNGVAEWAATIVTTNQEKIKKQTRDQKIQSLAPSALKFNSYQDLSDYCSNWNLQDISKLTQSDLVAILFATQKYFSEQVNHFAKKYGFQEVKCELMNHYTVLGRCYSFTKTIQLNIELLGMNEKRRHRVFLHELCHLKFQHHREEFWDYLTLLLSKEYSEYANCKDYNDICQIGYNNREQKNDIILNRSILAEILLDFYVKHKKKLAL
jgi:hypothetical protein